MATTILPINPVTVRAYASPGHRKPEVNNRKNPSPNWWSPLFGWPAEPDYINGAAEIRKTGDGDGDGDDAAAAKVEQLDRDHPDKPSSKSSRIGRRGALTTEKARQLRKMTTESSTFHDVMYHSSIASRLASDFSHLDDL